MSYSCTPIRTRLETQNMYLKSAKQGLKQKLKEIVRIEHNRSLRLEMKYAKIDSKKKFDKKQKSQGFVKKNMYSTSFWKVVIQ